MARQAALALDALQHRRLLAADIGAGTAAQHQIAGRRDPCSLQRGDLLQEDLAGGGVFVAEVDVGGIGLDGPGGDERAFKDAVRVGLKVEAVLEGAGLALVGVDREVARLRLAADEGPFPARRETTAILGQRATSTEVPPPIVRTAISGAPMMRPGSRITSPAA